MGQDTEERIKKAVRSKLSPVGESTIGFLFIRNADGTYRPISALDIESVALEVIEALS